MSTYAPDVEPISREMWEAREAARRDAPSARVIVAQFTANRQQRNAEGLEARANLWGSPSGSSFQSGKAGLPAPRNASRRSRPGTRGSSDGIPDPKPAPPPAPSPLITPAPPLAPITIGGSLRPDAPKDK